MAPGPDPIPNRFKPELRAGGKRPESLFPTRCGATRYPARRSALFRSRFPNAAVTGSRAIDALEVVRENVIEPSPRYDRCPTRRTFACAYSSCPTWKA